MTLIIFFTLSLTVNQFTLMLSLEHKIGFTKYAGFPCYTETTHADVSS